MGRVRGSTCSNSNTHWAVRRFAATSRASDGFRAKAPFFSLLVLFFNPVSAIWR